MMRYYFAGAYARRAELEAYADELLDELDGWGQVASRWLTDPQEGLDSGFSAGGLETPDAVAKAWEYAQRDLEDLGICHAIVSFTGEGGRGGRHIEHGVALDYVVRMIDGKEDFRLIVVGPREHIFHCHPATEQYDTFDEFLKHEIETNRAGLEE